LENRARLQNKRNDARLTIALWIFIFFFKKRRLKILWISKKKKHNRSMWLEEKKIKNSSH